MKPKISVRYRNFDFFIYDVPTNTHIVSHLIKSGIGWDTEQLEFIISSIANKSKNMIDVGGEIGSYSIPLSPYFNKIHTFEPNIENYSLIKDTIDKNNITQISLYNLACGDVNSTCTVVGTYSTEISLKEGITKIVRLDDFITDEISFIKIDVEGFEYDVLRGAKQIIDKYKPIIYLETHPTMVSDSLSNCETWLLNMGYESFNIVSPSDKFWKYNQ